MVEKERRSRGERRGSVREEKRTVIKSVTGSGAARAAAVTYALPIQIDIINSLATDRVTYGPVQDTEETGAGER